MKDNFPGRVTERAHPKELPHDYSCPSVPSETLTRRTCSHCGRYFASITRRASHQAACERGSVEVPKDLPVEPVRIRPIRVAARRQKELLCVMGMQEMEWLAIDEVDVDSVDDIPLVHSKSGTPILSSDPEPIWQE